MAEHNNDRAGCLPASPHPALASFERLIGTWRIHGPDVEGIIRYEWMEGGFFAVQHYDLVNFGSRHRGIEYTGFDEDTGTLRSRLMGTDGSRFLYTYAFEGDTMTYWFGEIGADTRSVGTFSGDGNTITGRWTWPTDDGTPGGYTYTMVRIDAAPAPSDTGVTEG